MAAVVEIEHLNYSYSSRPAIRDLSFTVGEGEIFGLLGPNGGGKSTVFRILSTILRPDGGSVRILNMDVVKNSGDVRGRIGVVFQSGSLDRKLTVRENLRSQGHLYGLSGAPLKARIQELLSRFGIQDRANDYVETLSGGLQRRVDIAKGMLHRPAVLLLDEPSTGLDPSVRIELWDMLKALRDQDNVTVVLTTHFMEEAERCDRLAILDRGSLIAAGPPDELRNAIGGEVLTIHSTDGEQLTENLRKDFNLEAKMIHDAVRIETSEGHDWIPRLMKAYPDQIESLTVGKPTLEDVFIHYTGHKMDTDSQ